MATEFILKAVTPEGLVFEKPVLFVKVRTENGDIGILAKHANFVSSLGAGERQCGNYILSRRRIFRSETG